MSGMMIALFRTGLCADIIKRQLRKSKIRRSTWLFASNPANLQALSQIEMIDLFGRMPVAARQWVQHVMAFELYVSY